MEVPQLIIDLAIMLMTAAVVTITFKKLRMPTILGYIVAGFLIGPNFPFFLSVESASSIETWSEIGVVIILFHIGLEFDFNKLADLGSTAIISAAVKMSGVMFVGYAFGRLLGMSTMDCVFLGAMLSISSTVVIQKCFEEMGLTDMKFSKLVMGSLVVEDVIAVFMMVILTTMAAGKGGGTTAIMMHLFMMLCYLIIWLVLGVFFVPTLLNRSMSLMSRETLTLLSIGFCFLMALLAKRLGFSMELGAFLAGSFFAGTVHVHKIEEVTSGIKDMFGAIFFLSVGMMVNPEIIASKWNSIIPIAVVAVVAKLIFAAIGVLLSGQDEETAIRAGTSLAPIGEFSFIIASLGISLGVMDSYLYPVIVAASILTIIVTPLLIKHTDSIAKLLWKIAPEKLRRWIMSYTSSDQAVQERTSEWMVVFRDYFLKLVIYGSIMLVSAIAGCKLLYPMLSETLGKKNSAVITTALIYLVLIVFTRPFLGRRNAAFTKLWVERKANRTPLIAMMMLKIAALVIIALIPLIDLFKIKHPLLLLLVPVVLHIIGRLDFVASYYLELEARFLANLNQKNLEDKSESGIKCWLDEEYRITSWIVPKKASYADKSIMDLNWGKNMGVFVVMIKRGEKDITMPPARTVIHSGDIVYTMGEKQPLDSFLATIKPDSIMPIKTLREFMANGYYDKSQELACTAIHVSGSEAYVGKPIRKSGINARTRCMILGIERDGYVTKMPNPNMRIAAKDILWIIGTNESLSRIAAKSVGEEGMHDDDIVLTTVGREAGV